MRFDPVARTLTLEPTDCRACASGAAGKGRQYGRKICAVCAGTGNGKRGKPRGCQQCFGRGLDIDFENTVPCAACNGNYHGASFENWCDTVPVEAMQTVEVVVVRQNRETTWNEKFLGAGCFWSVTDYGTQWEHPELDDRLGATIKHELETQRVQAVKLWTREQYREITNRQVAPVPTRVYVTISRSGYSIRPEVPHVTGATPDNTYAAVFDE